jgi:3-oxoacyl-[acyl-carrier-protein] synthase II
MGDLRPTLFLAQLSTLLAGNIAIVHGVCGTSRTFMGEEVAGVDATRIALARIAAGQSDIALIGGSHNGERKDLMVLYEFGDYLLRNKYTPIWNRAEHPGFALGSAGAFIVVESKTHATGRGAKPFARLTSAVADHSQRRERGDVTATLEGLWSQLGNLEGNGAIITGATGAEPVTSEERAFLEKHRDFAVRSSGTKFGHTMETQFPLGLALAALSLSRGALFPPADSAGMEIEMTQAPTQIVVIGTGHWRGEGMALVEAIK